MKKVFATLFFCIFVSAMGLLVVINTAWASQEKPIKLLYGTFDPPVAVFSQVAKQWAKELEERTKGRVKVDISFGFCKPGEIYDMTTRGMIDVGPCIPGFNPGQFPFSEIVGLPFVIPNAETGSKAIMEFVKGGYKDQEFGNVKTLFFITCAADSVFTKKQAVKKLDDYKGLKIHAGGPAISRRIKLMGGVPVYVPYPELYGALEKGILDGLVMNYAIMEVFRLFEVTNYAVEPPMGTGAVVHVMNKKKWDKLPADIQKIIDDLSSKYYIENARAWDAACGRGKKLLLDAGGQISNMNPTEIEKISHRVKPIWDGWISDMEKRGLPGKKAVDDFYGILKDLGVENPAIGYRPGG